MDQRYSSNLPAVITERRISEKAFVGKYVLAALVGLVVAVIAFAAGQGVFSPVGLLPLAYVIAQSRLQRASVLYRVYPDRLEVQSGLVSRKIENVQLFRVHDVSLNQGLMGRIGGYGDVSLHGSDSTAPVLTVTGVDQPDQLYQELRELIGRARSGGQMMYLE